MRRRQPKGAAASILVLFMSITLMMLTIMGYVTGRVSTAKEIVSARTDAVAMAMTEAIKRRGPDDFCQDPTVQALIAEYGGQCPLAERVAGTNSYRVRYEAEEMTIEVPTSLPFQSQSFEVRTRSMSEVRHHYAEVEERRPKFVLVLDYSGSMGAGFGGNTREGALKDSINALLDRNYRVDYGAVLFSSGVISTVGLGPNSVAAVRGQVNGHRAGGMTNYEAALNAANGLFNGQPNHGYYVLFATDGQPTAGNGDGHAQVQQMWNRDVTVFTLNIGAQGAFRALLHDLSGSPQSRHDPRFSFEAGNAAALRQTFDRIIGYIVCRVDRPHPDEAPDPDRVYISVERRNGQEVPVDRISLNEFRNNPEAYDNRPVSAFIPDEGEHGQYVLNQRACTPVLDDGGRIVLRYDRIGLAQAQ